MASFSFVFSTKYRNFYIFFWLEHIHLILESGMRNLCQIQSTGNKNSWLVFQSPLFCTITASLSPSPPFVLYHHFLLLYFVFLPTSFNQCPILLHKKIQKIGNLLYQRRNPFLPRSNHIYILSHLFFILPKISYIGILLTIFGAEEAKCTITLLEKLRWDNFISLCKNI